MKTNSSRDILTAILLALGLILWFGKPLEWKWPDFMGPYPIQFFRFCQEFTPVPIVACLVLAVVLFATRRKY